jgi:hypothetical protein
MFGSGCRGSILTTDDSTLGGGLKLLRPTFIKWSTRERSCTFAESLQYSSFPGLATRRIANSFWNISTEQRQRGRWANNLNTSGDEIWYGTLATHKSKYGSSQVKKSACISWNFYEYWPYLNRLVSSITIRGSISTHTTFLARCNSNSVRLPSYCINEYQFLAQFQGQHLLAEQLTYQQWIKGPED